MVLAADQPEDEAQNHANQQRSCERNIEAEVVALDSDIAGKPTEAHLGSQRPKNTEHDEHDAKDNEQATNRHALTSRPLALFARDLLLLQHIHGHFVLAQTEEGWMAHFTGAGPLGEFHLGDQLRLHPSGCGLVLDALLERRAACPEGEKPAIEVAQGRVREARADMTDIAPAVIPAYRENQRSEIGPRAARRREPGDDHLLAPRGLDLEPVPAALAREVRARCALGHDAFKPLLLNLLEVPRAVLGAMRAEGQQGMLGYETAKLLLALEKGETAHIGAIEKHEIEEVVAQVCLRPQSILQQLKAGSSILIERHQLTVEHRIALDLLQCFCHRAIAFADDFTIA